MLRRVASIASRRSGTTQVAMRGHFKSLKVVEARSWARSFSTQDDFEQKKPPQPIVIRDSRSSQGATDTQRPPSASVTATDVPPGMRLIGELDSAEEFAAPMREGLMKSRFLRETRNMPNKGPFTPLSSELQTLIKLRGPLTLASYIQECLQHPLHGYYHQQTIFGSGGDFVTSPEISQAFGETIAAWIGGVWEGIGSPKVCHLVEIGPGKGTMMRDILKMLNGFDFLRSAFQVHMVETSPMLRKAQSERLGVTLQGQVTEPPRLRTLAEVNATADFPALSQSSGALLMQDHRVSKPSGGGDPVAWGKTASGVSVNWHHNIESVPTDAPVIILAHEFMDALPVHQFQFTSKYGWCEKMVDIDDSPSSPNHFRLVLSTGATPAVEVFLKKTESGQVGISSLHVDDVRDGTSVEM